MNFKIMYDSYFNWFYKSCSLNLPTEQKKKKNAEAHQKYDKITSNNIREIMIHGPWFTTHAGTCKERKNRWNPPKKQ